MTLNPRLVPMPIRLLTVNRDGNQAYSVLVEGHADYGGDNAGLLFPWKLLDFFFVVFHFFGDRKIIAKENLFE